MSRLNKEMIRYLITGIFTTLVSLSLYFVLSSTVLDPDKPLELQTANLISIFSGKDRNAAFGYERYVYHDRSFAYRRQDF